MLRTKKKLLHKMSSSLKDNKRKKKEDYLDDQEFNRLHISKGSPRKRNRKEKGCGTSSTTSSDEDESASLKTEEKVEEELGEESVDEMDLLDKEEEEEGISTNSSFLLLPDELWLMIFSDLSLMEKARCAMVCHHFWKWSSDRILYRTLDFSLWPERIGSFRLTSFAAQPKTVDAEVLSLKGCANVTDKDMEYITSRWQKLRILDLEGCSRITKHSLHYIEMRCPRLTSLNIIGCSISEFNPVLNLLQSRKQPIDLRVTGRSQDGSTYPFFKSKVSNLDTAITFSNQTDKCAEIVWVDFEGGTRVYHRLNPGRFYSQHTFETHYWLMRECDKPENIFLHTVGTARPHVAEAKFPPTASNTTVLHNLYLSGQPVPVPICVPSGLLCSKGEKRPVTITFKNSASEQTYLIYWLGYEGEEIMKGELAASQEMKYDTFTSHVWRVKEKLTLDTYAEIVLTADSLIVQL